ncbi:MAG: LPS assembly protein LptD [Bdellovibrionales bacterium]|jgi:LPS-assembly protein
MQKRSLKHARRCALFGLAATLLWLSFHAPACAAEKAPSPPPLLLADHLAYDENTEIMTAQGHVEVSMNDKVLRADNVTYNKKTDVVQASGHVALTETAGEILFADKMEMTSDMKQGFIDQVGIYFPDKSRLVANDAQRYEGRYLITQRGIYSACDLCKDDPKKPPLWQLKGRRITHDTETKNVIYRDATLEFDGIPVFYTPYFSHPDPTVRRRQGFLTPTAGLNNTLGTVARTPYYFDIAPNSDLVVTPLFSTTDKLQMKGDWRYRFVNGSMKWSGSVARTDFISSAGVDKGQQWRGHLFGTTLFDLTPTWRAGTDIAYTTDKSYLQRYSLAGDDVLVNRAYVENFKGRNYASGNMYYFKDQRPGSQLVEPVVAPEMKYSAFGEPNKTLGGRWSFNSGLLVTSRRTDVDPNRQGANTRRLSLAGGWERQMASSIGFLTTVSGLVRSDSYWADHVPMADVPLGTGFTNVVHTRPFVQGDLSLRYPLGRHGETYQQLLEPIAVLSVAPRVSRHTLLPNEDSLDMEFDETNLFSPNRYAGNDRVEGGTRAAYGLRHAITGANGGRIEMVGGQVFRLNRDSSFNEGSGLTEQLSDYVGRLDIAPNSYFNINYGFRLDQKDLTFSKQEVRASAGPNLFRPSVHYLSVNQPNTATITNNRMEEVTYSLSSAFAKYWSLTSNHTQAINPAPGPRSTGFGLIYEDECFRTGVTASRNYTERVDVEAGRTILFQFYLRNIGGFTTN